MVMIHFLKSYLLSYFHKDTLGNAHLSRFFLTMRDQADLNAALRAYAQSVRYRSSFIAFLSSI